MDNLRDRIVETVVEASNGELSAAQLEQANGDLMGAGFSSMNLLNLMELLELKFGIILVPERDSKALLSVSGLEQLLAKVYE